MRAVASLAVAGMAAAAPAGAAVVLQSHDTGLDAPVLSAGILLAPTATTGTVRVDFVGNDLDSNAPNSRSPYDGTAQAASAYYHSVSRNATATYRFGSEQSSFAFMWGSPDSYNTLNFYLGQAVVGSFTGSSVIPYSSAGAGRGFVDVVFSGRFDRVVFGSGQTDAFEFTNLRASPVPVPAAAWLLLSGLAGLGIVGRRRNA